MNTLAHIPAAPSLDVRVENTGGLYALGLFYLGYAYFYFCLPPTGGL